MQSERANGTRRARIEVAEMLEEPLGEIAEVLASSLSRLRGLPSSEVGALLDVAEADRDTPAACDVRICLGSDDNLVVDVAPHFPPLVKALITNIEEREPPEPVRALLAVGGLFGDERRYLGLINIRLGVLRLVAGAVCEAQSEFLRGREKYLRPLMQQELGAQTKLSVSTVSRALKNKTIDVRGKVMPFEDLLSAPAGRDGLGPSKHAAMAILRELHEADTAGWLTDTDLQEALEGRGIRVARRTVAKYRSELGLVSSYVKKRPGRSLPEELLQAIEHFVSTGRSFDTRRLYRSILLRTLEQTEFTSHADLVDLAKDPGLPERFQAQFAHLMPSTKTFYDKVIRQFIDHLAKPSMGAPDDRVAEGSR